MPRSIVIIGAAVMEQSRPSPAALIAVVGLRREARAIGGVGVICIAGGGVATVLNTQLSATLEAVRIRAILSIGLGGALAPKLKVSDWVVAERVVSGERSWATDAALVRQLQAAVASGSGAMKASERGGSRGGRVFTGAIAASDVMLVDAAAKAALHAATGALAVDMESHVAAAFAAEHGLPFAALRVISDGADRALPKAAQAGMKPDGGMDVVAVLRALARDPRQLPAMIRTGREAEAAFRQLKLLGRHDLLGRLGVGDPDLGQLALDMV